MVRTYPHFNPFSVIDPENLDFENLFADKVKFPINLEIGCSNGRWLLDFAKKYPQQQILGVETRSKYVTTLAEKIKTSEQKNAAVIRANINTAINKIFQPGQLQDVFIMFPDPWYKAKHLKRRVVQPQFITDLSRLMVVGAKLHIATDKLSFAEEMLAVLTDSCLQNTCEKFSEQNIEGIVSEIESFHLLKNNPVYRLVFVKK